jgi:glycosyltransferase involved in cell wall biosynthesis
LPIEKGSKGLPFATRQIKSMAAKYSIEPKIFYLESRTSPTYLLKAFFRLKKQIRLFDADLVHAHYGSVNALFSALSSSVPLVITYHGSDLNITITDGRLGDFFARLFSNVAALFSTKIIIVSENLRNRLWWNSKKAAVIPIGTDTEEFFPFEPKTNELPEAFSYSYPTIVFNANNPKIKRLDLAEKAVEELKKDYPEAQLFIMRGNIPPTSIPAILNVSDIVLLCSDSEGSPTIIKEAMACNTSIVSTDVGDVKERVAGVYEARIVKQTALDISKGFSEVLDLDSSKVNGREILLKKGLDEASLQAGIYKLYKGCLK